MWLVSITHALNYCPWTRGRPLAIPCIASICRGVQIRCKCLLRYSTVESLCLADLKRSAQTNGVNLIVVNVLKVWIAVRVDSAECLSGCGDSGLSSYLGNILLRSFLFAWIYVHIG